MTKAEIVQNLLDAHQITAEQAVILLTNDSKEKEYIFIPRDVIYPYIPYNPQNPLYPSSPWWQSPFTVTCSATN